MADTTQLRATASQCRGGVFPFPCEYAPEPNSYSVSLAMSEFPPPHLICRVLALQARSSSSSFAHTSSSPLLLARRRGLGVRHLRPLRVRMAPRRSEGPPAPRNLARAAAEQPAHHGAQRGVPQVRQRRQQGPRRRHGRGTRTSPRLDTDPQSPNFVCLCTP